MTDFCLVIHLRTSKNLAGEGDVVPLAVGPQRPHHLSAVLLQDVDDLGQHCGREGGDGSGLSIYLCPSINTSIYINLIIVYRHIALRTYDVESGSVNLRARFVVLGLAFVFTTVTAGDRFQEQVWLLALLVHKFGSRSNGSLRPHFVVLHKLTVVDEASVRYNLGSH